MTQERNVVSEEKVAVHSVPYITRAGWRCERWREYLVVVGIDPTGPRRGHRGSWGSGKVMGRYRTRTEAEQRVKRDFAHLPEC
jgi:hypothetical protein